MNKLLKELVSIRFGIHLKPQEQGEVKYIQAGCFSEKNTLLEQELAFTDMSAKTEKHVLQSGDILLAGKGNSNFAWVYSSSLSPAVASSLFYVLSIQSPDVLPEYLSIYINQRDVQRQFKMLSGVSSVPSLKKSELQELPVFIPSLEKQRQIIHLFTLQRKEIDLFNTLVIEKEKLYQAQIKDLITSNS